MYAAATPVCNGQIITRLPTKLQQYYIFQHLETNTALCVAYFPDEKLLDFYIDPNDTIFLHKGNILCLPRHMLGAAGSVGGCDVRVRYVYSYPRYN